MLVSQFFIVFYILSPFLQDLSYEKIIFLHSVYIPCWYYYDRIDNYADVATFVSFTILAITAWWLPQTSSQHTLNDNPTIAWLRPLCFSVTRRGDGLVPLPSPRVTLKELGILTRCSSFIHKPDYELQLTFGHVFTGIIRSIMTSLVLWSRNFSLYGTFEAHRRVKSILL